MGFYYFWDDNLLLKTLLFLFLLCQAGDSTAEELANATQVQGDYMPIVREKPTMELVKLTSEMKSVKAFDKIRLERTNKRHAGARAKRAADAEKEEKKWEKHFISCQRLNQFFFVYQTLFCFYFRALSFKDFAATWFIWI